MQVPPNRYGAAGLDRMTHVRRDKDWLTRRLESEEALIVPVWRTRNLIVPGEAPRAGFVPRARASALIEQVEQIVLLGTRGETTYFALDLSHHDDPTCLRLHDEDAVFEDIRRFGADMPFEEAGVLAYARGILHWHARHGFCGACGAPTESRDAGHVRVCTNPECGAQHFPRTDPAVIMLVSDGERALLGRKSEWPEGRYSTLAGFVEPGESLEEAVAREVMEETGIAIENVRYHSSQPWPFPASLMLGFFADALTREVRRNDDELEDARWFTRDELRAGAAGYGQPQRADSIARRLMQTWVEGG